MTRKEHLLVILAEECAEVAQACSKALRFGIKDSHIKNNNVPNDVRITEEIYDLLAVYRMCVEEGLLADLTWVETSQMMKEKKAKIEEYFHKSRENGTLTE